MTLENIFISIIILLFCYVIFSIGRLYESCIIIREIKEQMQELLRKNGGAE